MWSMKEEAAAQQQRGQQQQHPLLGRETAVEGQISFTADCIVVKEAFAMPIYKKQFSCKEKVFPI